MLYQNIIQLWQNKRVFHSNRRQCSHDSALYYIILIHVISCMILHLQVFLDVLEIAVMLFFTISLISTFSLLSSDVAFYIYISYYND
jgi:hypothetical protein